MKTRLHNFIGGKFCPPVGGGYFDDIEPASGERIAEVPDSDERDIDSAVRAARKAFASWSRTPIADRSRLLLRLADLIEQNAEELAQLESRDSGKAISLENKHTRMYERYMQRIQQAPTPSNKVAKAIVRSQ